MEDLDVVFDFEINGWFYRIWYGNIYKVFGPFLTKQDAIEHKEDNNGII